VAIVITLVLGARALHLTRSVPVHSGPTLLQPIKSNGSACGSTESMSGPSALPEMVSTTDGWASGPLHTSDGGAHWTSVAPQSISNRADGKTEVFLDATHAWVATVAGSAQTALARVVIFGTSDGGQTWQQSGPLPINPAAKSDVIWQHGHQFNSMCFIDARHGWLLTTALLYWEEQVSGIDGTSVGGLYRTSDGGLTWTLISSDPASGALKPASCQARYGSLSGIVFSSTTTGWLGVYQCASSRYLLVTRDGGTTWALQSMPMPWSSLPYFIDQNNGFITVSDSTGFRFQLASTSDGGLTWTVRGPLPFVPNVVPANPQKVDSCGGVTFVDPTHGWCVMGRVSASDTHLDLYRTSDGGQTWLRTGAVPDSGTLRFIDTNTGFLSTYKDSTLSAWLLFKTVDGGATWTRIATTIAQ
jgi:photosystem II stability/assembly factor-like uncharacterized protein